MVLYDNERVGCSTTSALAMEEFNSFTLAVGVSDCGYSGYNFTWAKKEHGNLEKFAALTASLLTLFGRAPFLLWRLSTLFG